MAAAFYPIASSCDRHTAQMCSSLVGEGDGYDDAVNRNRTMAVFEIGLVGIDNAAVPKVGVCSAAISVHDRTSDGLHST